MTSAITQLTLTSHAKSSFLEKLSSTGKMEYKRYSKSPLRYAGGKSLAVGFVVKLIPVGVSRLVSPFFGGGAVEIACANELGLDVIGYDVFDILTNYWDFQINSPDALADELSMLTPSRSTFKVIKERLRRHWNNEITLDDLELAYHYYFNSNTSYGPHFLGWPSDVYLNETRYNRMIDKVSKFHSPNLSVECMEFEKSIPKHSGDFLYCDPPYYLGGKMFVGMYPHRNFPIHHNNFKHELLRDYLLSHKGGFILSYNDCPTIRDWYSQFNMITPVWQYTFGQGDTRIGVNRKRDNAGSHVKKSHELLIWSDP